MGFGIENWTGLDWHIARGGSRWSYYLTGAVHWTLLIVTVAAIVFWLGDR